MQCLEVNSQMLTCTQSEVIDSVYAVKNSIVKEDLLDCNRRPNVKIVNR
jgi:hypothetical protein